MTSTLLLAAVSLLPTYAAAVPQRASETNEALTPQELPAPSDPGSCDDAQSVRPDSPVVGESFGRALDVDGNTLVVGAPGGSPGGFVYVFTRSGTSWEQQARLFPPTRSRDDRFGSSVSIDGDTLAIGSGKANISGVGTKVGRAYVFVRTGTSWALERSFKRPSNGAAGDLFGWAVSLSGNTLMVGAPGAANRVANSGLVFVYTRSGASWSLTQEIEPPRVGLGQRIRFGASISMDGSAAVIGMPSRFRAKFYHWTGSSWAPRTEVGSGFVSYGRALALHGDLAAISDPQLNRVELFMRNGQDWVRQPDLPVPPLDDGDLFGRSLAMSERFLVVGSSRWGSSEFDERGCAYVFARSGSSWKRPTRIVANDPNRAALFGTGVALQGDSVFAGAPNPLSTGTAYEFDLATVCGSIGGGKTSSLTAAGPRVGQAWKLQVDPKRTGHTHALILGHSSGGATTLPGGQVLSVSGPVLFRSPLLTSGTWSVRVPDDPSLVGESLHVQAVHLLGGAPYALSNALEQRVRR